MRGHEEVRMGLFQDLLDAVGLGGGPAGIRTDPSLGDPEVARFIGEVRKANFSNVDRVLGGMTDGAWDDRDFVSEIVAQQTLEGLQGSDQMLQSWCDNQPGSAVAHLLAGRHAMGWAWEARGYGKSDTVSDSEDDLFEERLVKAQQHLRRAAELEPGDPTPWACLISVQLRGLGGDIDLGHKLFSEAVKRDPLQRTAHIEMVMALANKWSGAGHEPMFEFARQAAASAPDGSDVPLVLMMAHLERWLWESHFEEDDAAADAYLEDSGVLAEAAAAYDRSLGAASHVPRRSSVHFHNLAAAWFYLVEDRARLSREIAAIGTAVTDRPWQYLDDPGVVFAQAKELASGG
jgi:hypothetical protein